MSENNSASTPVGDSPTRRERTPKTNSEELSSNYSSDPHSSSSLSSRKKNKLAKHNRKIFAWLCELGIQDPSLREMVLSAFVESSIPLYDLYRMLHPTKLLKEVTIERIRECLREDTPDQDKAEKIKTVIDSWYDDARKMGLHIRPEREIFRPHISKLKQSSKLDEIRRREQIHQVARATDSVVVPIHNWDGDLKSSMSIGPTTTVEELLNEIHAIEGDDVQVQEVWCSLSRKQKRVTPINIRQLHAPIVGFLNSSSANFLSYQLKKL